MTKAAIRRAYGMPRRAHVEIREQVVRAGDMIVTSHRVIFTLPSGERIVPHAPLDIALSFSK